MSETTSSQVCIICGATPKQMNNLDVIYEKTINIDSLKYGLSPLHAYIRFYECLLHIAYRLDIKKWRVSTGLKRKAYEKKKK